MEAVEGVAGVARVAGAAVAGVAGAASLLAVVDQLDVREVVLAPVVLQRDVHALILLDPAQILLGSVRRGLLLALRPPLGPDVGDDRLRLVDDHLREMQQRCRRDAGEMQARCRGSSGREEGAMRRRWRHLDEDQLAVEAAVEGEHLGRPVAPARRNVVKPQLWCGPRRAVEATASRQAAQAALRDA